MQPKTASVLEPLVRELLSKNPSLGRETIARILKVPPNGTVRYVISKIKSEMEKPWTPGAEDAKRLSEVAYQKAAELAEKVASEKAAEKAAEKQSGSIVVEKKVDLPKPEFGWLPLEHFDSGDWITFGVVADTHLCCKEERLAELHAHYDLMEREGIAKVFHAGNIVDGYIPKINGGSVYETSVDGQCQYVIDNYPRRNGMTTFFITGDDHEGWWMKEGFNFGAYLNYLAKDQGREDLQYIGHVEADVEIKRGDVSAVMKVQHPGGGSAYARSYTSQRQLESLEGGEKPSILLQGHYHVSNYMNDRNVHAVSLPGFQDQTIFARKKRLRMEVGGGIIRFKLNPEDGSVTRFQVEINRFFTRAYYKKYLRSDAKVLKGHLEVQV